jgi:hypothetical protein
MLTWKTNQVNNLWFAKTNTFSSDTNRPLIGKINKENKQFNITRLRPVIQTFLPQVFVKGQIMETKKETVLILKFQPSFLTTVFLMFLIWGTIQVITQMINSEMNEIIWDGFTWILVFPVMTILLLFLEVKNTMKILHRELELKNE